MSEEEESRKEEAIQESSPSEERALEPEPPKEEVTKEERIYIRTYPKISVMAMTLGVISLIFGIIAVALESNALLLKVLAVTFIVIYFFLLLIMAFEFSEWKFISMIMLFVILGLLYMWLSSTGNAPSIGLKEIIDSSNIIIYGQAYLAIAAASFLGLIFIWLKTRFNYWIIEPNQVLHKTGIFGKVERYSTRNMKFTIDITDILEYWLFFGSGTLILDFPLEKKTFALSLVPNVKKLEKKLQRILGYTEVG